MRYIEVQWHHDDPDMPISLYSEIDDVGWEQRKVEIFADGRRGYADANQEVGTTMLGLAPIPSLSEIAADTEFSPREILRDEFETLWKSVSE